MRKIVLFSVRYPVTIMMIVLGILLLGYISYDKLGVDLFPDLNNPRIFIEVQAGERPPEEMERQFVENIEALTIRQSGVTQISSVTTVGASQITVEYNWDKDMDEAFLDMQRALNSYSQNAEIDELNISRYDPNSRPVMIIGLSHPQISDMNELRKVAENYIRNELIRLDGVADVTISGQERAEVIVETDPYKLEAFGLTADEISNQIESYNQNISGGSVEEMNRKYVIKGVSIFGGLSDMEDLVVTYRDPQPGEATGMEEVSQVEKIPVFLRDVATLQFRNAEPLNITRLNGKRCLGLSAYKETKFNTVKAVEELEEVLDDIRRALPGYEFQVVENQGKFISAAIWEVEESALLGIFFAVIILFVFLRRLGSTLVISIAIPISVVATFNLMYFNDLTLNIMTLGGLALGAGMLVDNAIVVMENIYRNRELGMTLKEAAIEGTSQVGGAITASTITTIIVFLPIVYLHGSSGELFKEQAWTVAFSLISSLFVAILVIPMLFATLFKERKVKSRSVKLSWYGPVLKSILSVRWVIIIVAGLLVTAGIYLVNIVGSEYMPGAETREFTVEMKLPEGTRLERTAQAIENIEGVIRSVADESKAVIFSVAGPSVNEEDNTAIEGENRGSIKVILTDSAQFSTSALIKALGRVLGSSEDLEINFIQDETALQSILGTDQAPIVVEIAGDNFEEIERISDEVMGRLSGIPDLFNIKSSIENGNPEIEVMVDRLQASINSVSVEAITSQIENRLKGTEAGQFDSEGEMKDILIKLPEVGKSELEDITIRSGEREIPLTDLARIELSQSPREINRRNQNRVSFISASNLDDRPFDHIIRDIRTELAGIDTSSDYTLNVIGEEQKREESLANLSFAMILSIILVYMVLASQFESLIHPFTILLTIPLAGVGAILIFFIAGLSLNIMAYIGIIMLIGIAVNDSIILVDAINRLKKEGKKRLEAILEAGQYRIRPIIMTSLTTILALLPLTFGFGESASLRQPMALAVIGGLVTSTLLTLVVIPCVYYVLDQLKDLISPSKQLAE